MIAPQSPLRVSEALHQHDPRTRDVGGVPACSGRYARKPVARHRRNHQIEGVRRACAVCGRIVQRIDNLQLLDHRARPAVCDDERQRVLVLGTNVNEMDVQPIYLGDELRIGVQSRLDLAPVVLRHPIAREFLQRRELGALGLICGRFPVRPLRRGDTSAEVDECLVRNGDVEGPYCVTVSRSNVLRRETDGTRGH
jgi:hypothetical protein